MLSQQIESSIFAVQCAMKETKKKTIEKAQQTNIFVFCIMVDSLPFLAYICAISANRIS